MSFEIATSKRAGGTVYQLFDTATGASASVLPAAGFNCFDLRLPLAGKVRPVLSSEPDWADQPRSFGRNGTPVLFPFPNRIRGGRYRFGDKDYDLPLNGGANAIHGFAISAPWDVVEHRVTEQGASLTGVFQLSKQAPEMLTHWPADAVLQIQYTLAGRRLDMEITVTNPTATPLPYGFGIHPYFRLPFEHGGDQARTQVILPAQEFWVLDEFLPTGERRPVTTDRRLDFREGQPMTGLKLDDVLTGLRGAPRVCRLVDEALGAEFRLTFDEALRELVVYTPPGPGGLISLEPYTQTTDAINLQTRGIDAGLRVLGHGQRDVFHIAMETAEVK